MFSKWIRDLFFSDATHLVRVGKKKILNEEDVLELPDWLDPKQPPVDTAKIRWESGRALIFSLMRTCRQSLGKAYIAYALTSLIGITQPVLVNQFVSTISAGLDVESNFRFALVCAVLLGLSAIFRGVSFQHFFFQALKAYQITVNLLNERIYQHSLRLTQKSRLESPVGDVVNHMSSDTDSVADIGMVSADLFFAVVNIVSVMGLLFYYIGWSAVVPFVLLALLGPATRKVAQRFSYLDEIMMKKRDHRVTLMGQILNAIRVVKYFAWEKSVIAEIEAVRNKELEARRKMARAEAFASVAYVSVSSIVLFSALGIHVWRGFELTPALVFTLVALFGLLEEPFGGLSWMLSRTANAFVGAERIARFLSKETLPEGIFLSSNENSLPESVEESVGVQAIEFAHWPGWTFKAAPGESIAIVGPVGCGKSTLLLNLLGEDPNSRGQVVYLNRNGEAVRARRGYVPQEAYIINGTLRDNLLFGSPFVSDSQLMQALAMADFEKDLKLLSAGLQTEIGEKGVNLSGGQKQRVSLARAILRNPQIVFLDDPLSAVDVETENNLVERLLFGQWKKITRIVATHRLEHLAKFDRIVFMENGRISAEGTFEEVRQQSARFRAFIRDHESSQGPVSVEKKDEVHTDASSQGANFTNRITDDEDRETGAVKSTVYLDYFRYLGGEGSARIFRLFLLMGGAVVVMALPLLQRWWLGMVSNFQQKAELGPWGRWLIEHGYQSWLSEPMTAVYVYGGLGLLTVFLNLLNNLFWLERGIGAGRLMHQKMLTSMMKAPMRFFDATPVGRILQRFSRDVESVDIQLQRGFSEAIHIFIEVILCMVLILSLVPSSFILIGPVLFIYYVLQRDYRRPAREVKRMDSVARSPRYSHFKETLLGLPVIRGFQNENWFKEDFYRRLAHSQRLFYNHILLNRWFSARIPVVGGLIAMSTTMAIVMAARSGNLNAGVAGVLTVYMLSFWAYLNWGIRLYSEIETRMTSVERIKFYTQIPPEKNTVLERENPLDESWPRRGEIVFEKVQARYASHLPRVLHDVSFHVEAGEKVGLIGRTGSGKSTIFQCLFRFLELESGRILIDGEDIASIPLERLRRSLAIIPQDPTLFLGTIRSNLDRFAEFSDEEIHRALEHASLSRFVESLPEGIHSPVAEGGLNLSQGQRQLLCLARALLTGARIIVLDEATASVDVETDAILQKIIREKLQGVTLLIIAHRLGTVADCDKVIDLAFGRVQSVLRPEQARARLAEIEGNDS